MKLSKKGVTPSQIGVTLRDSHGVAQVQCPYAPCDSVRGESIPPNTKISGGYIGAKIDRQNRLLLDQDANLSLQYLH